jgi:hypothetical protein
MFVCLRDLSGLVSSKTLTALFRTKSVDRWLADPSCVRVLDRRAQLLWRTACPKFLSSDEFPAL